MSLNTLLDLFHKRDVFFRFENDEDGYHLSIIDRSKYPRIWADNFVDNKPVLIVESTDNLINRTIIGERDWKARFTASTIDGCIDEFNKWDKQNRLPRLK